MLYCEKEEGRRSDHIPFGNSSDWKQKIEKNLHILLGWKKMDFPLGTFSWKKADIFFQLMRKTIAVASNVQRLSFCTLRINCYVLRSFRKSLLFKIETKSQKSQLY